ncbi:shikimate kinase AroL [Desulfobaculum sp.]
MPRNIRPENAMKKKVDVAESDQTMTFKKAERPTRFGPDVNVYLVGLRACGKSTLGRELAKRMHRPFIDTDDLVVDHAGRAVAAIVEDGGWQAFRDIERDIVQGIDPKAGAVVATGGGVILDQSTRAFLRSSGPVFYLMADVALLAQRLGADPKHDQRPALSGGGLVDELSATLAEREALYMETSHFVLPAQEPLEELVEDVREKLMLLQRG